MAGSSYKYMYQSKNSKIMVRVKGRYLGHFTQVGDAKRVLAKHLKMAPASLPRRKQVKKQATSKNSKYVHVYRSKSGGWEVIVCAKKSKNKAAGRTPKEYIGRFKSENDAKAAVRKYSGQDPIVRKKAAGETKRSGRGRFAFLKACFKDRFTLVVSIE